jgi:hypothetical protein
MNAEARSLCEYVRNVIDEALHDRDPARVRARKRLHGMLARCANVTECDFDNRAAKPSSNPWLQLIAAIEWPEPADEPVKPFTQTEKT